jgi:unsaturated rhamnogalacturonyl hydrolase
MSDQWRPVTAPVADRLLSHPWKLWFWGDSIGLEGLLAATDLTGNQKYFGYVYGLLKAWAARQELRGRFEYTAAGVALLSVYQRTGDACLLECAFRHADYLSSFRKTLCGAYIRDEGSAVDFPPDLPVEVSGRERLSREVSDRGPFVFVDSIHFDGPLFAKLYEITGNPTYCELALDNILPQIDLLFDPQTGLFHHYWSESAQRRNGVFWARGNGWGVLGLARTLEHLPASDPRYKRLQSTLQRLSTELIVRMDACGGWHTVLDDPASYIETSAGAFFVDALATAALHGWLICDDRTKTTLRAAMGYLLSRVAPDGTVEGVSHDTFPSNERSDYANLPRGAMVPWGQGPFLTALLSYSKFEQQQEKR